AELGELREAARASGDPHPEVGLLQAQLAERDRLADSERTAHAEEAERLRGIADAAEARLQTANAELDELREAAHASGDLHLEISSLQARLAERDHLADSERTTHAEDAQRLRDIADAAEARLQTANAELDELREAAHASGDLHPEISSLQARLAERDHLAD